MREITMIDMQANLMPGKAVVKLGERLYTAPPHGVFAHKQIGDRASNGGNCIPSAKIDSAREVILVNNGNNYLAAHVVTVDTANKTFSVTMGTVIYAGSFNYNPCVFKVDTLGDNSVRMLAIYHRNNVLYARLFKVAPDNTITLLGSETAIQSSTTVNLFWAKPIPGNDNGLTFIVAWEHSTPSVQARVLKVDATTDTISFGSIVTLGSVSVQQGYGIKGVQYSMDGGSWKYLIWVRVSSYQLWFCTFVVSGLIITVKDTKQPGANYTDNNRGATAYVINPTTVLLLFPLNNDGNALVYRFITINASTDVMTCEAPRSDGDKGFMLNESSSGLYLSEIIQRPDGTFFVLANGLSKINGVPTPGRQAIIFTVDVNASPKAVTVKSIIPLGGLLNRTVSVDNAQEFVKYADDLYSIAYPNGSDGNIPYYALVDITKIGSVLVGIAKSSTVVVRQGVVSGFSGLSVGARYNIKLGETDPTPMTYANNRVAFGDDLMMYAISPTELLIRQNEFVRG